MVHCFANGLKVYSGGVGMGGKGSSEVAVCCKTRVRAKPILILLVGYQMNTIIMHGEIVLIKTETYSLYRWIENPRVGGSIPPPGTT